ncbi:hypothetical protein OF83DRAFT_1178953, partial [Amylostereum chailletii]
MPLSYKPHWTELWTTRASLRRQGATTIEPAIHRAPSNATSFMPTTLWQSEWTPVTLAGRDLERFGSADLEEFSAKFIQHAQQGRSHRLNIQGRSAEECVRILKQKVAVCLRSTDFSPLLTNDVHITITSPSSSGIGDRVRSTGDGITVEVWNMAYKSVMEGDALQLFFRPNPDDTYGIAPATAIGSPQRDEALGVLGFFIGYEIALGRPANPCDPSLLLLFLSGLQFDSLTKAVIQEWHPQLCNILTGFLEAGPQGDVSPFQIPLVQYLNPIMLQ